jgi:hypothetical protein
MRPYRIQYTRHPNLRQHGISRFKNRTNHALPNPDISLATDTIQVSLARAHDTDDDFTRANQQMEDIRAKYPNLDVD